jgi:uncharacterized phage-associated protein
MSAKSLAVAKYLLDRSKAVGDGAVTPMQLTKLAYLAHGWMLGIHGRPLLDEEVGAWQYGPVVPSIYHAVKQYRSLPVQDLNAPSVTFDAAERSIMDQVVDLYGKYSGIALSSMTHQVGTPWDVTCRQQGQRAAISNDLIENFYKSKLRGGTDANHGF